MTVASTSSFDPIVVDVSWTDDAGAEFRLACCFGLASVRHAVEKHFGNASESWGRLLSGSLVGRLTTAARGGSGWMPTLEDFAAFVDGVGKAMQTSGKRPMVCRYAERNLGKVRSGRKKVYSGSAPTTTVQFILQSGGVAFVGIDGDDGRSLTGSFRTCYFPRSRQNGWTSGKRAYAASVEHFVMKWALHAHRSGSRRLPDAEQWARCQSEGREVERGRFTFFTPETWGFRPADDGVFLFRSVPTWQ